MGGTMLWLLQRLTGVMLFAGFCVHFYVMHFSGSGQLDYEAVSARLAEPSWVAFNLIFLASALYHGFNGLWGIAVEHLRGRALRAAQAGIGLSATGLLAAGVWIVSLT